MLAAASQTSPASIPSLQQSCCLPFAGTVVPEPSRRVLKRRVTTFNIRRIPTFSKDNVRRAERTFS